MKFGLRFFCLPIHPMRIGNTMMNSMLFNVLLLLISCVSVVQFCTRAFASYARLTAAAALLTHVPAAAGPPWACSCSSLGLWAALQAEVATCTAPALQGPSSATARRAQQVVLTLRRRRTC